MADDIDLNADQIQSNPSILNSFLGITRSKTKFCYSSTHTHVFYVKNV